MNCNGYPYNSNLPPHIIAALRNTYWEDVKTLPNFFNHGFSKMAKIEINDHEYFCGLLGSKYNTGIRSMFNHPATVMLYDRIEDRIWRGAPVLVIKAEDVWNDPIYCSKSF